MASDAAANCWPVFAPPATAMVLIGAPGLFPPTSGPKTRKVTRPPSPGAKETVAFDGSLLLSGEPASPCVVNTGLGMFEMGIFCTSTVNLHALAMGVG